MRERETGTERQARGTSASPTRPVRGCVRKRGSGEGGRDRPLCSPHSTCLFACVREIGTLTEAHRGQQRVGKGGCRGGAEGGAETSGGFHDVRIKIDIPSMVPHPPILKIA